MKTRGTEDQSLIADISSGKRSAFSQLYDHLFAPLYAFGYKYISDNVMLDDFVQEAFVSFWHKQTDFNSLAAIKSFLYTSVKNHCLNHIKHKEVRRKNEDHLILRLEDEQNIERQVIEEETFNALFSEIKHLPKSSQQIMLLALNGLKNPEIAEELDISINTVKSAKKKAYTKLRSRLSLASQSMLHSILF